MSKYTIAMMFDGFSEDQIKQLGKTNTPSCSNSGNITIRDPRGLGVIVVYPVAPRKRSTPYDAPDAERDAFAQRVCDALNAVNVEPPKRPE